MRKQVVLHLIVVGALAAGCGKASESDSSAARAAVMSAYAPVVALSPYLEAAVRDVLGSSQPVTELAGPGSCPGHFDLRPSHLESLRSCRLLLRFEFQSYLDEKLIRSGLPEAAIRPIPAGDGLAIPATYLGVCRGVAAVAADVGLAPRGRLDQRLREIADRLQTTADEARRQVAEAGLVGEPVVASSHQAAFCRWLGLAVAATLPPPDTARVAEVEDSVRTASRSAVRFVVANRPEGRKQADALAARLSAQVVVFDNFPALEPEGAAGLGGEPPFDRMVLANAAALSAGRAK